MKYLIICGPTCSGKTSLGIWLARQLGGEIIGADSRQIYKNVDIGTAKPKPEEYAGLKYHLIDFLDISESFSAYKYGLIARELIISISKSGKIPIVVGGTGLYLKALTEGFFDSPEPDPKIRDELEKEWTRSGSEALYAKLAEIDPAAAKKISPNDKIRIIRALEVFRQTGIPISIQRQKSPNKYWGAPLWIGLNPPRKILYSWIDLRVEKMIADGWEKELYSLLPKYDIIRSKKILGYMDMFDHILSKKENLADVIPLVKQRHRNYAKRQVTWFSKINQIKWFDPSESEFQDKVFQACVDYFKKP